MENRIIERTDIKGWGVDADPEVRPAWPMWNRPEGGTGAHWDSPEMQPQRIRVLTSIERPRRTAVFGATLPPRGLSGLVRRAAFRYSEGSFAHWLPLLLADRINVVEGILDDLRRGHVPNIPAEMGLKAELKYNKKGLMKRLAVGAAMGALLAASARALRRGS